MAIYILSRVSKLIELMVQAVLYYLHFLLIGCLIPIITFPTHPSAIKFDAH